MAKQHPMVNMTGTGRRVQRSKRPRKMLAFGFYGGKYGHLDFILPHIPIDAKHFCDVYGGSAAIILNMPPAPVETYNDLDGELCNFFKVLRDNGSELTEKLQLTPFSRQELAQACEPYGDIDDVERARRFYVRARQTRTALAQASTPGRWAHYVLTSRREMAGSVSRWQGAITQLPDVTSRLLRVQIENAPAVEVVVRYDTPDTVFYLDPPYVHSARGDSTVYAFEMTDADHEELAALLHSIRGRAVLSGYRTDLYDRLYEDWTRIDGPIKTAHSVLKPRRECLWLNFDS